MAAAADIWGHVSLRTRFARIAHSCADLAAVIDPAGRSWTYRELDRCADGVAALLHRHGVGHGDHVATSFDRSPEVIAAILGIVKLGAVYVPLDSRLPAGRLEFILKDTAPAVILAGRFARKFSAGAVPVVTLDDVLPADLYYPEPPLDPEAPAYVMYTSGSTGQPKGVIIPHRAVLSLVEQWPFFPLGPGNRSLVYSPSAFDSSTFEIWGPLLTGGACVVLEGAGVPALIELRRVIETHAVNWLFFTPALFNLIIDGDPDLFAGVRSVIVGGEAMSVRHARKAKTLFPGLQLINGYGPTETTVFSNCWEVPEDFPADTSRIPIGPPLPHATAHLVRSDRSLAASGETAELWIGGDGVGLGYLNREELTAEKFVPGEFSGKRERRLYRTGDFARRLPDGSLDFLGRMDGQIKLRGLRIEVGDIECAVEEHPTVGKCVVKLFGEPDHHYLAGFYTCLNAEACSASELREFLQARLPDYMIPTHLVPLERLPLTANGKVDRDALKLPTAINSGRSEGATDIEQKLINILSEILRARDVSRDSCFFAMGGTSLDALQLCLLVERDLDFRISPDLLLTASTPRLLAERVGECSTKPRLIHLLRAGDAPPLFCIPGQGGQALNFRRLAHRMNSRCAVYGLGFPRLSDPALQSIENFAAIFMDEICGHAPQRHCSLLGYSMGGAIAYEVACRLCVRGIAVQELILLDALLPYTMQPKSPVLRLAVDSHRMIKRMFRISSGTSATDNDPLRAAFGRYRPGPFQGGATFIRTLTRSAWSKFVNSDHYGGYRQTMAGECRLCWIPGEHLSVLRDPYVSNLAEVIDQRLSQVDACRVGAKTRE